MAVSSSTNVTAPSSEQHTSKHATRCPACCRKVDATPRLPRRQVARTFGIADDVFAYDEARPWSGSLARVNEEPPHPAYTLDLRSAMTQTVRVHARAAITTSLLALTDTLPAVSVLTAQHAPIVPMRKPPRMQESTQLVQRIRIRSLSGDADAFGSITFAALRRNREIVVADDQTHRVSVFGPDGKLKRHLGGRGQGPGEFELHG